MESSGWLVVIGLGTIAASLFTGAAVDWLLNVSRKKPPFFNLFFERPTFASFWKIWLTIALFMFAFIYFVDFTEAGRTMRFSGWPLWRYSREALEDIK